MIENSCQESATSGSDLSSGAEVPERLDSPVANPCYVFFQDRESRIQSSLSLLSINSLGRKYPEPPHPYRGPFQRDRDRIVHCSAYRRLSEKMQVFTIDLGTYHRTRLTHTLEVTSVARTLARALQLNEDYVEVLAMLHDIGHPPFGHTGEDALHHFLIEEGGFNHNRQALRIVEKLEQRYPDFPGLNLSRETLFGQEYRSVKSEQKRNGVAVSPDMEFQYERFPHPVRSPFLEVQVVDAADSISYDSHDADDALELGFLAMDELLATAIWRRAANRVKHRWSNLSEPEFRRAAIHDLIDEQVCDLLDTTLKRLAETGIDSTEQVLNGPILAAPSEEMQEQKEELERFLFKRVYRHPKVLDHRMVVRTRMETLFQHYLTVPETLPQPYHAILNEEGPRRAVADYLADQTDRSIRFFENHSQ